MSAPVVDPQAAPNPATTNWVPVGPGPMPDFRYRGDWAAGSYSDGDIVVYNGVTYLCVLPTSSTPVAWAPPSISPSYGTTLPASPADGMEAVLVDSVTNPTYQWRFRYNAGSTSPYKWEFIGGTPARSSDGSAYSFATLNTWTGGLTPTFTAPRSGEYLIEIQVIVTVGASTGWFYLNADLSNAPNAIVLDTGAQVSSSGTGNLFARSTSFTIIPASVTCRVAGYPTGAGQAILNRAMYATPRRVS